MRKYGLLLSVAAVLIGWAGTAPAWAEDKQIALRNAPPGVSIEIVLMLANESKQALGVASAGGELAVLLDFGNLGKAQPIQIQVFIQGCDGAQKRVLLVVEGADVPRDCDEQRLVAGETTDRCGCRRVAAFLLTARTRAIVIDWLGETVQALERRLPGSAVALRAAGRATGAGRMVVLVGGSAGRSFLTDAKTSGFCSAFIPPTFPLTPNDCSTSRAERSGGGHLHVRVLVFGSGPSLRRADAAPAAWGEGRGPATSTWLGATVGWQNLGSVALNGTAGAPTFRGQALFENRGFLDAHAFSVEGVVGVQIGRAEVRGSAGVARWQAKSGNTQTLTIGTDPPIVGNNYRQSDHGIGPKVGAAFLVRLSDRLSVGPAYHRVRMNSKGGEFPFGKETASHVGFFGEMAVRK